MKIETVTRNGKTYGLVAMHVLERLQHDAEMLADIQAYDAAMEKLAQGEEELIPFDLVERRIAGDNPLKLWREFRAFSQQELAEISGVSRAMIAAMEVGTKHGSIQTIKALARALRVEIENIA